MLGIHPDFISYLNRLAKGERVIWSANVGWLSCFSERFSGEHDSLIMCSWNGMFELAFEFDTDGHYDTSNPIGVQFLCPDGQFANSGKLLTRLNDDGSIFASELWKDAVAYLKADLPGTKMDRASCALAGHLLRREKIRVPKDELVKILSGIPRH
jgi:hypothetical protein